MEAYLEGRRAILVVAQKAWEHQGGNYFSTLCPVLLGDGEAADSVEFPNNGLVWWYVRPAAKRYADPGRLVIGTLDRAPAFSTAEPDKTLYQVKPDAVSAASPEDLVEILTIPTTAIEDPREMVARRHVLTVDHPPMGTVYVRWRNALYGPFQTDAEAESPGSALHRVSLRVGTPASAVVEIPESAIATRETSPRRFSVMISTENLTRAHASRTHNANYEVLLPQAVRALETGDFPRITLRSPTDIVRKLAKNLLSRKQKQELSTLLNDLRETIEMKNVDTSAEEIDILGAMKGWLDDRDRIEQGLADALVESGLLEERLKSAIQQRTEDYVNEHATRLQAETTQRVAALKGELKNLDDRKRGLEREIETRQKSKEAEFERYLETRKREFEESVGAREENIRKQTAELERLEALLSQNLQAVTEKFTNARDEVLNQFLTIAPLLSNAGVIAPAAPGPTALGSRRSEAGELTAPVSRQEFRLPEFITSPRESRSENGISEEEFFDRFRSHVASAGFRYRPIDLVSFHLSVKCCDLTILGGVSGTGKSTLPRLYAEALHGDEPEGMQRYLLVGVSPAWLDMRDLMGHVNALDGQYHPADSGLYEHLIRAVEEDRHARGGSGIYVTCLDEMNLSHVEHYFSGFLQVLEQPTGQRLIRCFSSQSISPSCPFAPWPTLDLPPALRFVGTVNFDETTKQLSLRVLDRANLIRLRPGKVAEIPMLSLEEHPAEVAGPPIAADVYRSWIRTQPLEGEFADLVDELRPEFAALGCPLSPRRLRAISQFIASAPPAICPPKQALDLQIAQRLLPQVRGVYRRDAIEALDAISRALERDAPSFPESLHLLHELQESDTQSSFLPEP